MKIFYLKVFYKVSLILLFIAFFQHAKAANPAGSLKMLRVTGRNFNIIDTPRHVPKSKIKSKKADKDKDEPEDGVDDDIKARLKQEVDRTKDPVLKKVPIERIIEARRVKNEILSQQPAKPVRSTRLSGANPTNNSISDLEWTERGPDNIGGRTRALLFDLGDAANGYKKVFAGGVDGGLWYTNDITATPVSWTKINDFFENIAISCISQNPVNPKEIYVGTGEGWQNVDGVQGLGVWKTEDGGATWLMLANTSSFKFINAILVDRNGSVYVAGNGFGIQKSGDGGATWNQVIASPADGADLQLAANGDVYASTGVFSTGNVFISDYSVNGTATGDANTWVNITPETTGIITPETQSWWRIKLTCAPNNANVVYALMEGNQSENLTGVERYNKAKNKWTVGTVPPGTSFANGQAWYSIAAAVDPHNANILYAGSLDAVKSTDGGLTWTPISQWEVGEISTLSPAQYVHADHHAYVFPPGSSSRLAMGTDGGVFYTSNANDPVLPTFLMQDNSYNVTQFYSVALHPTNTNYALAGSQDNGTQQFTTPGLNATNWAAGGDGGDAFIDQLNGNIQIISYTNNNRYVSVDNGATFTFLGLDENGSFINPSDYDSKQKILYAGELGGQYLRWDNVTDIDAPSTTAVMVSGFNFGNITAVTVSPITANGVYFGLDNGTVVRVDDAQKGAAVSGVVLSPNPGTSASVSCVAVDPASEDHLLVSYFNYGVVSIFETKNATAATPVWTSVEGNLPDMPVRWCMFYPGDVTKAIIATELGVWTTDRLNARRTSWNPTNSGLANVEVDMLKFRASDRTLAAATHGRGLYTTILPAPAPASLLTDLAISNGTLAPAFATGTTAYSASVGNAVASITITPTAIAGAAITVNGTGVPSGSASPAIALSPGLDTIKIAVTSQDRLTVNNYTITVTRTPLAPAFSYNSPQSYTAGTAISPLAPLNTGGAAGQSGYNSPLSLGTGFNNPKGVAIDAAGNVYVADAGNNAVKKIPAGGGASVTLGSGFKNPAGVAVDAAGDVYVADAGNNAIKKIPAGGGAPRTLGAGVSFNTPSGIALDASGNAYVTDANNNLYEIPRGGGPTITLATGFNNPNGVAVDGLGNIYIADTNNHVVWMAPFNGGNLVTVGSGFIAPEGVAVDEGGNIYVTDGSNSAVYLVGAGGAGQATIGAGFNLPFGIGADGAGNVYLADAGNNAVKKLVPAGGYYISPFLPAGLIFNSASGIISGMPLVSSPATNYTVTAYNQGGGASAALNITVIFPPLPGLSYKSPQVYDKGDAITPLAPASTAVANPGYRGNATVLASGFNLPGGVAVDAKGNLYVADEGNNVVTEIPAGGGAPVNIGSGFYFPCDVKLDAAGNIYVVDRFNNAVKKIPAGGGAPITIGAGFSLPTALAIDAAGNVYVADFGNSQIKKIAAGKTTAVVVANGIELPTGVAVDNSGNLYVVEEAFNALLEIPRGGAPVLLSTSFSNPFGVAADVSGNVFVADNGNNAIKELPAGGTSWITAGPVIPGPIGITVDFLGNIVTSTTNRDVQQISPGGGYYLSAFLPRGLSFSNATGVFSGTPTILSPPTNYMVTAYSFAGHTSATVNISVIISANANLANLALSKGTITPVFSSGTISYTTTVANDVTSITLTPTVSDENATVTVDKKVVKSGSASAPIPLAIGNNTITTIVKAQNGKTTRTYTVVVYREKTDQTITFNALKQVDYGAGDFNPGAKASSGLQIMYTSSNTSVATIVNGKIHLTGVGTAKITASQGGNNVYNPAAALSQELTVDKGPQSIDLVSIPTLLKGSQFDLSGTTATSGLPVTFKISDSTIASLHGRTLTAVDIGIAVLTVLQPGNKDYLAAKTEKEIVTVNDAAGDEIFVHKGVSPNGDGKNDFLYIEGIDNYPDNSLTLMNPAGVKIFAANHYDNKTNVFDGHSNISGVLQPAGTYFYLVEYVVNGQKKNKTGYIELKYQ